MDAGVDGRWLTYARLAEIRRIDKTSALKLAIRHKWPRQKSNRGQMQVYVPLDWAQPPERLRDTAVDEGVDLSVILGAHEDAKAAFAIALKVAEGRADAAEARADRAEAARDGERARAEALRELLEAAKVELRAAEARRERGRWARLRAAWRGE